MLAYSSKSVFRTPIGLYPLQSHLSLPSLGITDTKSALRFTFWNKIIIYLYIFVQLENWRSINKYTHKKKTMTGINQQSELKPINWGIPFPRATRQRLKTGSVFQLSVRGHSLQGSLLTIVHLHGWNGSLTPVCTVERTFSTGRPLQDHRFVHYSS